MVRRNSQELNWSRLGRCLALVVLGLFALNVTGCKLFKRGKKDDSASLQNPGDLNPGIKGSGEGVAGAGTGDEEHGNLKPLGADPYGFQPIYFDYDSSAIRADQSDRLEHNLDLLKKNDKIRVSVEGNCDERGTTEYNYALGERRSRVVIAYFAKAGIDASRLVAASKGEENPVATGHDESAWSQNRRCEFIILAE